MSAETSTKNREESFEVVVVGAGPVGLVSAIQLGRAGIETLLLERRATFSTHPKSGGIHARTMEIYRQLGISDLTKPTGPAPTTTTSKDSSRFFVEVSADIRQLSHLLGCLLTRIGRQHEP